MSLADWARLVLGKCLVKVTFTVSLESVTKPQPSGVSAEDLLGELSLCRVASVLKSATVFKWRDIRKKVQISELELHAVGPAA